MKNQISAPNIVDMRDCKLMMDDSSYIYPSQIHEIYQNDEFYKQLRALEAKQISLAKLEGYILQDEFIEAAIQSSNSQTNEQIQNELLFRKVKTEENELFDCQIENKEEKISQLKEDIDKIEESMQGLSPCIFKIRYQQIGAVLQLQKGRNKRVSDLLSIDYQIRVDLLIDFQNNLRQLRYNDPMDDFACKISYLDWLSIYKLFLYTFFNFLFYQFDLIFVNLRTNDLVKRQKELKKYIIWLNDQPQSIEEEIEIPVYPFLLDQKEFRKRIKRKMELIMEDQYYVEPIYLGDDGVLFEQYLDRSKTTNTPNTLKPKKGNCRFENLRTACAAKTNSSRKLDKDYAQNVPQCELDELKEIFYQNEKQGKAPTPVRSVTSIINIDDIEKKKRLIQNSSNDDFMEKINNTNFERDNNYKKLEQHQIEEDELKASLSDQQLEEPFEVNEIDDYEESDGPIAQLELRGDQSEEEEVYQKDLVEDIIELPIKRLVYDDNEGITDNCHEAEEDQTNLFQRIDHFEQPQNRRLNTPEQKESTQKITLKIPEEALLSGNKSKQNQNSNSQSGKQDKSQANQHSISKQEMTSPFKKYQETAVFTGEGISELQSNASPSKPNLSQQQQSEKAFLISTIEKMRQNSEKYQSHMKSDKDKKHSSNEKFNLERLAMLQEVSQIQEFSGNNSDKLLNSGQKNSINSSGTMANMGCNLVQSSTYLSNWKECAENQDSPEKRYYTVPRSKPSEIKYKKSSVKKKEHKSSNKKKQSQKESNQSSNSKIQNSQNEQNKNCSQIDQEGEEKVSLLPLQLRYSINKSISKFEEEQSILMEEYKQQKLKREEELKLMKLDKKQNEFLRKRPYPYLNKQIEKKVCQLSLPYKQVIDEQEEAFTEFIGQDQVKVNQSFFTDVEQLVKILDNRVEQIKDLFNRNSYITKQEAMVELDLIGKMMRRIRNKHFVLEGDLIDLQDFQQLGQQQKRSVSAYSSSTPLTKNVVV